MGISGLNLGDCLGEATTRVVCFEVGALRAVCHVLFRHSWCHLKKRPSSIWSEWTQLDRRARGCAFPIVVSSPEWCGMGECCAPLFVWCVGRGMA